MGLAVDIYMCVYDGGEQMTQRRSFRRKQKNPTLSFPPRRHFFFKTSTSRRAIRVPTGSNPLRLSVPTGSTTSRTSKQRQTSSYMHIYYPRPQWGAPTPPSSADGPLHPSRADHVVPTIAREEKYRPLACQSRSLDDPHEVQRSPPRWPIRKAPRPRRTHRRGLSRLTGPAPASRADLREGVEDVECRV